MEGILSIKNLSKSFERNDIKTEALRGVSFELKCGEILGIVGTSGSGKSTLLRLISGLEAPDAGSIRLDGHELGTKRSIAEKRDIQMIFQDAGASFHPRRTIASSINDAFQSLMGKGAVLDLDTLCLNVGLSSQLAQRYPGSLSGGQCQLCHCASHCLIAEGAAVRRDNKRFGRILAGTNTCTVILAA